MIYLVFCQTLYSYRGGIDGTGMLANAFKNGSTVHKEALVAALDVTAASKNRKKISSDVFEQYRITQKSLANVEFGHLSNEHPLTSKLGKGGVQKTQNAIKDATKFEVDQLIYVEIEVNNGKLGKIRSVGHHYQYRWAYTSSVHVKNDKTRPCLAPHIDETVPPAKANDTNVTPEKLTGARLLFGYVRDDKTNPIGKGVYERLAGRIAINHAVSVGVPKFLGDERKGYCVPLKILGQPKSSAWEFYLQQDASQPPATYGDLPGEAGGELAGRKFYRHQPRCQGVAEIAATDAETIQSDQATLARFICAKESVFKFALRFARLRPWELGALLAVLEPQRLARTLEGKPMQYAHKLGLGRPLGMGSVGIKVVKLQLRSEKDVALAVDEAKEAAALEALKTKLASCDIGAWLDLHEFADRGSVSYPVDDTRVDGQPAKTIYAWHTKVRQEYSQLRRKNAPNWDSLRAKIKNANSPKTQKK